MGPETRASQREARHERHSKRMVLGDAATICFALTVATVAVFAGEYTSVILAD
ncbi:hypothetical protein [Mycolicibacterium sarraceniae]|uniref:Uncharacterized protein n=1 Tax=Mycolicibacterium sarraceniae TaxID=1534348 RepID=A0A7I7SSQ0_9MYCO|nr:hypothetical protein [Mycolicibacterium sarraceniae]BBY59169.1 hypothetical protein MSAR_23050 [Mycolicibacterium sarraceniae]